MLSHMLSDKLEWGGEDAMRTAALSWSNQVSVRTPILSLCLMPNSNLLLEVEGAVGDRSRSPMMTLETPPLGSP